MSKPHLINIKELDESFNEMVQEQLPFLKTRITAFIATDNKDCRKIECYLDMLLSLNTRGAERDLFIKLLEYYKTIDSERAIYYWTAYDEKED